MLVRKKIPLNNYTIVRSYNFWSRNNFGENPLVRIKGHDILRQVLYNFAEFILKCPAELTVCETQPFLANRHPGTTVLTCSVERISVKIKCSQAIGLVIRPSLELQIGNESGVSMEPEIYCKSLHGWAMLGEVIKGKINEKLTQ